MAKETKKNNNMATTRQHAASYANAICRQLNPSAAAATPAANQEVRRYKAQRDRRKRPPYTCTTTKIQNEQSKSKNDSRVSIIRANNYKRNRINYRHLLVSAIYSLSLISLITSPSSILQQVNSQPQPQPARTLGSSGGSISRLLPDLASSTSDESIVAVVGQDAFISCVAKNLQNYTIIWRYTNEANAPALSAATSGSTDLRPAENQPPPLQDIEATGTILTAGRQRVVSDSRFSVIQSHDTWLLKISNVRQSDTGTYVCHTNSVPVVRVLRILSVVKPAGADGGNPSGLDVDSSAAGGGRTEKNWSDLDYSFADCCRAEFVAPRCQRLCSFQQLSSKYRSINIVHDCYPSLPAISRCMVGGRNVTDCCERRHIPQKCKPMCGHQGDISSMSVQDQSYCADYSASIMSLTRRAARECCIGCPSPIAGVAEGIDTLPGQPELVIVEAVSSTTLKVSWQKVADESELRKVDGWIINLTKLSSFEDTIAPAANDGGTPSRVAGANDKLRSPAATAASLSSSLERPQITRVSSSFSTSVSPLPKSSSANSINPLAGLTIVDATNNSSLASMTKSLATSEAGAFISLKLEKSSSEFSIDNLKPYTVYQIQMFAYNSYGRSQLTDPIRALTLAPESANENSPSPSSSSSAAATSDAYVEPTLPNTRKCCLDHGVTLKSSSSSSRPTANNNSNNNLTFQHSRGSRVRAALLPCYKLADSLHTRELALTCNLSTPPPSLLQCAITTTCGGHRCCLACMCPANVFVRLNANRCLDTLCDPVEADRATIADLMICAPWSNVTFSCLSSRVNHTDCCKSRGVSPFCLSMCSGDVKRVDYRHFRCLTHMSTYTNCILESHNVLPSAPQNFTVGPITSSWAVLNWRSPKRHAKSLQGYRIFWRRFDRPLTPDSSSSSAAANSSNIGGNVSAKNESLHGGDNFSPNDEFLYSSAEAATNPYLLDALQPNTVYETFVVAVNRYGQSDSSVRFVFQTLAEPSASGDSDDDETAGGGGDIESRLPLHGNNTIGQQSYYNETECCVKSGVHDACTQLCDYQMKVSDVPALMTHCNSQMPVILRCMAGNRNSVPCCRTRGVSDSCLNVCAGLTEHSPLVVASRCAADFGKMMRCMDEGSKQIPGAPVDLHTVEVRSDRIKLRWLPSSEDSLRTDIEYHVRYQQLQPTHQPDSAAPSTDLSALIAVVPLHPLEHNLVSSTNQTEATVEKLKPNSRYSIYVTAENGYGISLPSLVLVVQTPAEEQATTTAADTDYNRRATLGSPHSLEILRSDTETIVLKWIAPLFINSDAQIKYRVFYKMLQSSPSSGGASSQQNQTSTESGGEAVQQVSGNWSVLETNDTTAVLRKLPYSSQFVITVQAYSKQMLGHMSEILLAQTAKPIPPTLNHPLVINNPVEGNNITIMCVALGQPTPQISMFINGLLVQKRTQPYVFYHLVNLVRGHLTITCFASNGHGKDYASVQSRTEVSVKFPGNAVAKVKRIRASLQSLARLTCEVSGNPQPTVVWTFAPSSAPVTSEGDINGGTMTVRKEGAENESEKSIVITPGDRISTLLVSKFENPFTWTHTLTVRNVSLSDLGTYKCRARNVLSESSDSIQLVGLEATSGGLSPESSNNGQQQQPGNPADSKLVEQNSDLMECCKSQNVSTKCLPVCSVDGLDVEAAFKIPECQTHLEQLMFCAADGSDHRNCCRTRQVPTSCLRWCSGARLSSPALCFLSSAIDINQCFQEGRTLLPGPPRNMRVMLASESEHAETEPVPAIEVAITSSSTMAGSGGSIFSRVGNPMGSPMGEHSENPTSASGGSAEAQPAANSSENEAEGSQQSSEPLIIEWDPPVKNPALAQYYRVFWRPFGSRDLSRTVTNLTWIKLNDLSMNKMYEFVVKAANNHGSSVYSEMLTVKPAEIMAQSNSIGSAGLTWFMPSSSSGGSLIGRVFMAICFATVFMFSSLALVVLLEKRGYLRGFASSKSNSSRVSFANPAYLKDSDGNNQDGDNITWTQEPAHSLDILAPPPSQPASKSQTNVLT